MALNHAQSGQVVSVLPLGEQLAGAQTAAILKAEQLEVVRLVLPAGKAWTEHKAPGEITLQCIEGCIEFRTADAVQVLNPGDFIFLRSEEPHALRAIEDSSALLTLCIAGPH
jgi:quercetin dioxygenase-like cupin family protein